MNVSCAPSLPGSRVGAVGKGTKSMVCTITTFYSLMKMIDTIILLSKLRLMSVFFKAHVVPPVCTALLISFSLPDTQAF